MDLRLTKPGCGPPWLPQYTTSIERALAALQPEDSDLTAIAALTTTSFGRGLLELADASALLEAGGLLRDADAMGIGPYDTFYLDSSGGDDTNDGLTSGTAFETFDYAIAYISSLVWRSGTGSPSLEIADGVDYETNLSNNNNGLPAFLGCDGLYIYSASANKSNVTIDTNNYLICGNARHYQFQNITFSSCTHTIANQAGILNFNNCAFGLTGSGFDPFTAQLGGTIMVTGTCTFTFAGGSTPNTLFFGDGGRIETKGTFTIAGSPTFSVATVCLKNFSDGNFHKDATATTFPGTVAGQRYSIVEFSRLWTGSGGANYLPGNSGGAADGSSTYL